MEYIIAHSAKGSTWKKHKYIEIRNGRYVYKDDEQRRRNKISAEYKRNTATNESAKEKYDKELQLIDVEQELADLNRPLSAKLENAYINLYDKVYGLVAKTGILDKSIQNRALERKNEETAKEMKTAEFREKRMKAEEERIRKENEKKEKERQKYLKNVTKNKNKKNRTSNFRERISIRK